MSASSLCDLDKPTPFPLTIETAFRHHKHQQLRTPTTIMSFLRSRRAHRKTHTVQPTYTAQSTYASKPSLFSRLTHRTPRAHNATTTHHTTRRSRRTYHTQPEVSLAPAPVHHQRRRPSLSDKVSGAILKLKGSITNRPGQKAAGTRRMHGTDGRGIRRGY